MLCPPALIYLVFVLTQIVMDLSSGGVSSALIKIVIGVIICFILNLLCSYDLTLIAWILVFIPFLYTTLIVGIVMYIFGTDVASGKIQYNQGVSSATQPATTAPAQGTPQSFWSKTQNFMDVSSNYKKVSIYYDTIIA